jgi:hypothetical protein
MGFSNFSASLATLPTCQSASCKIFKYRLGPKKVVGSIILASFPSAKISAGSDTGKKIMIGFLELLDIKPR